MFDAYACPTCTNKLTRKFNAVKRMTAKRNEQCKAWHRWYLKQVNDLNKMAGGSGRALCHRPSADRGRRDGHVTGG